MPVIESKHDMDLPFRSVILSSITYNRIDGQGNQYTSCAFAWKKQSPERKSNEKLSVCEEEFELNLQLEGDIQFGYTEMMDWIQRVYGLFQLVKVEPT